MTEQFIYAGFLRRALAFSLDFIGFILINTLFASIIMNIIEAVFKDVDVNSFNAIGIVSMTSLFIVFVLYFAFAESSNWQGTPGKKLAKIKVIDQKGRKLTFSKALARSFAKFFSVLFFCGYLFIFFNKKRQALHDYISNTIVVSNND